MTDFAIREVSPTSSIPVVHRLSGQTVLIPRGGRFAEDITPRLTALGAQTIVAPVVDFASSDEAERLREELAALRDGRYDWLVLTSATTVDVLVHNKTVIPESTRVAAIGETTAQALAFANFRVDSIPSTDNSPRGFLAALPEGFSSGRVLVPHAETSEPLLVAGFADRGIAATFVQAYRSVTKPVPPSVVEDVRSGIITAILVSSGSIARQLALQLSPIPVTTSIICIGPRTAYDAQQAGLRVSHTATERTNESLVDALLDYLEA